MTVFESFPAFTLEGDRDNSALPGAHARRSRPGSGPRLHPLPALHGLDRVQQGPAARAGALRGEGWISASSSRSTARTGDTSPPPWVLVLAFLTLIYYLIQRGRDLPSVLVTNKVLLFVLVYADALLILVILFVLARNLVRLWLERRQRALGARFKTKLVATYVGLSLVPVLLLFFYASELLQGSIDRWFSSSLRSVLEQSSAVAQSLQREIGDRNYREAAAGGAAALGASTSRRPHPAGDAPARSSRNGATSPASPSSASISRPTSSTPWSIRSPGLNDLPEVGPQLPARGGGERTSEPRPASRRNSRPADSRRRGRRRFRRHEGARSSSPERSSIRSLAARAKSSSSPTRPIASSRCRSATSPPATG